MAEAVPTPSAPAPSPAPAPGVAATGQPKVQGARNDSQARIDELAAQRGHYKRLADNVAAERDSLRNEIAELRGQVKAMNPAEAPTPKNWGDMTDRQLDDAKRWARQNDNAETVDAVLEEKSRREALKMREEAVNLAEKRILDRQHEQTVRANIIARYGADAFDPESKLFQAADSEMSNLIARVGKDRARDPDNLDLVFFRANQRVNTPAERERSQALQEENAQLRQRATLLERGGPPAAMAAPPNEGVKAALAANDRKAAIKSLGIFRSLSGQAKADVLSKRG